MSTTFSALALNLTFLREAGRPEAGSRDAAADVPTSAGSPAARSRTRRCRSRSSHPPGNLFFGVDWPHDWAALVVFVIARCGLLRLAGVALSHAVPNFDSAPAYVNAVFLPVILISGVFFDADDAPAVLHEIAHALPLKHLIEGLSGAMVTGEGSGKRGEALGVLAVWTAVGCCAGGARVLVGRTARLTSALVYVNCGIEGEGSANPAGRLRLDPAVRGTTSQPERTQPRSAPPWMPQVTSASVRGRTRAPVPPARSAPAPPPRNVEPEERGGRLGRERRAAREDLDAGETRRARSSATSSSPGSSRGPDVHPAAGRRPPSRGPSSPSTAATQRVAAFAQRGPAASMR